MHQSAWMLLAALLATSGCSGQPPPPRPDPPPSPAPPPSDRVDRPATVPAAKASLADGDAVVGVVVLGKARAYRLDGFKFIAHHVVNDVVSRTAVTVTYCDRDDCLRVFTGDGEEPLPVGVGGYDGGLLLRVGNGRFRQKAGSAARGEGLPYRPMPFERVSWGEWKKAHPDTDVYLGRSPPRPALDW
jgi:hypothetical protein